MKQLTLLASLCGCLSVNVWAQATVDLAPITIDGESGAEPGLSLDQSSGMASPVCRFCSSWPSLSR